MAEEEPQAETEEEAEEPEAPSKGKAKPASTVSLYEPMFIWIFLLLVAVVFRLLISNTSYAPSGSEMFGVTNTYSNFILNFPGTVILPLIIGAIIGSAVGKRSTTMKSATKSGILNGIYAALIYVITIIVIYMVLNYATPQYASAYTILFQDIIVPVVVFMVALEAFAVLSHLRRVE